VNTDSQTMTDQDTTRLFGYEVDDSTGNKIGDVDGAWVDDATGKLEFIAVRTGWLFGKDHLIPIEQAQIDDQNRTIQVPYSGDQIKNGPSFDPSDELSPDDEEQIYSYYGVQRSTSTSPTGYAAGTTGPGMTSGAGTTAGTGEQEIEVPLSEEELVVGKRQVQAGNVRLRKIVRTEHEEVPVQLTREEVDIERVPAAEAQSMTVPDNAFQEETIDVPVMEEEPVAAKEAHVTGAVRLEKEAETTTRTVGADVRREDVELDAEGNPNVENDLGA